MIYTFRTMRRVICVGAFLLVTFLPGLCATRPNNYQAAKIVNVEQKTRSRVLYYLVNTPVEKEEPYFEISVQVKDTVYTGEYSTRHAADSPPAEWLPGTEVEARVEKHFIFIKREYGEDLRLITTEHRPALADRERSKGSPSSVSNASSSK